MNSQIQDYYFYIIWEDTEKNAYRIGILAQIDSQFYLKMNNSTNNSLAAKRGYIGIPGFQFDKIYKSSELFDFFKYRILDKKSNNPCEELLQNSGKSMVDSFSLEEIPNLLKPKCKEVMLELDKVQNSNVFNRS